MKRNYSGMSKSNFLTNSESRASRPLNPSTPTSNYSANTSDHSSGYSSPASANYGNLPGVMAQQTPQQYYAGAAGSGMDTSTLYNQTMMYQQPQMYQQPNELMLQQQQQQKAWSQQQQQPLNANSNGLPFFNPEYPPPVNNYGQYSGSRSSNNPGWGNNGGGGNSGSAAGGGRNSQYRAWTGGNTSQRQKQQQQPQQQQQQQPQQQQQQQHQTNSNNSSSNTGSNNAFLSRSITAQSTVAGVIDSELKDVGRLNITINKKSKRKPMSSHYTSKEWNPEDALKVLALEKELSRVQHTQMLILKFPDPELNKEIIKTFSPHIHKVHFQQPSTPRYCFVQLKPDADLMKVKEELSDISFGTGKIMVEVKSVNNPTIEVSAEDIDPYTIYVGNLPTNISVNKVKAHFPNAARIDIGFAQRMKYTRYAFIRYDNVEDSIAAFKRAFETDLGPRSLVIRFRRKRGNIGLNNGPTNAAPIAGSSNNNDEDCDINDVVLADTLSDTSSILNELSQDGSKKTNDPNVVSALSTVTKSSTSPTADLNIVIKKEPADDSVKSSSGDVLLGRDIKIETVDNCDDISDDEFFNDLPATNDDAESDFGEDEFLPRNTSLALDEHYWNTELTEKLIKQEGVDIVTTIKKEIDKEADESLENYIIG